MRPARRYRRGVLRRRRRRSVVEATADGFVLDLSADERAALRRLLDELRSMLVSGDDEIEPLLERLFPPAYLAEADAEAAADYRRLMREELVASRLASIGAVIAALESEGSFDEHTAVAMMRGLNEVRLVLGTLLDVSEETTAESFDQDDPRAGQYQLYGFLSWLVEHFVEALSEW